MNREKSKLYIFLLVVSALLVSALFIPSAYCRAVAALLLAVVAGVALALFKKRKAPSIYHRQVLGILAVITVVYTVLMYMSGIEFGFYKQAPFTFGRFFLDILPLIVLISAMEVFRTVMLSQDSAPATAAVYVIGILADLALGYGISEVADVSKFMDVVGLTLFPAITSNIMYHYMAKRYGMWPNIAYRLLITLPLSLLPVIPAVTDVLHAFILMLLPLGCVTFIDLLYKKNRKKTTKKTAKWSYVGMGVSFACMAAVVMLVSGQFQYKLLVISTPSMTGSLNVGDAIIYEEYDGEVIEEGDVVVFTKDDQMMIVHRVVDIQRVNGQVYYTTKGDANDATDAGYITAEHLRGVVRCKVPHVGHPSLWLRDLFS